MAFLVRNPRRHYRHPLVAAVAALCAARLLAAESCVPGDSAEIVSQIVHHELDAAPSQGRWMYTAAYSENKIPVVARKIETDDGILTWVVSRGGIPLTSSENDRQRTSLNNLIADPGFLNRNRKAMRDDAVRINTLLASLPTSVQFDCLARNGSEAKVDFKPKPGYSPWNLEQRVIAGMSGTLVLDLKEMRLISADGAMQNDLSLFLGFGRIYKGSSVSLKRARAGTDAWETIDVSTHIKGQLLFLKTIAQDRDESRSDYCLAPNGLKARDALSYLENRKCQSIQ